MTTGSLDRRLIYLLGGSLALILVLRLTVLSDSSAPVVTAAAESIPQAEQRLDQLRRISATVSAKEALEKQAASELATREKGLIPGDTEAQSKAQLLELITSIARSNQIETHGMEESHDKPLSPDYGEISVTVSFNCGIENLVNFLAALANQPQILATNDIRVAAGNDRKKKTVQVRLSVSGLVPRKLLPTEKKGLAAF